MKSNSFYSINSGTSTLRAHAKRHCFFPEDETQMSLSLKGFVYKEITAPIAVLNEKVIQNFSRWIVNSTLPLKAVENEDLKRGFQLFDADFFMPYRNTIATKDSGNE